MDWTVVSGITGGMKRYKEAYKAGRMDLVAAEEKQIEQGFKILESGTNVQSMRQTMGFRETEEQRTAQMFGPKIRQAEANIPLTEAQARLAGATATQTEQQTSYTEQAERERLEVRGIVEDYFKGLGHNITHPLAKRIINEALASEEGTQDIIARIDKGLSGIQAITAVKETEAKGTIADVQKATGEETLRAEVPRLTAEATAQTAQTTSEQKVFERDVLQKAIGGGYTAKSAEQMIATANAEIIRANRTGEIIDAEIAKMTASSKGEGGLKFDEALMMQTAEKYGVSLGEIYLRIAMGKAGMMPNIDQLRADALRAKFLLNTLTNVEVGDPKIADAMKAFSRDNMPVTPPTTQKELDELKQRITDDVQKYEDEYDYWTYQYAKDANTLRRIPALGGSMTDYSILGRSGAATPGVDEEADKFQNEWKNTTGGK